MNQEITYAPKIYQKLLDKSNEIGFSMPSDMYIGSLLKTLVASKPKGNFLELGTGIGLSLSWMIDGMDYGSRLTTIDNDQELVAIAKSYFGTDKRVKILCEDGASWLTSYQGEQFDLVFADAWPGKYSHFDELFHLIKPGGIYVIDDMKKQPNWPTGHDELAEGFIKQLEAREDLKLTKMDWSTGVIVAVKQNKNNKINNP